MLNKLRVVYPNIMKLDYENTRTKRQQAMELLEDVKQKSPLELFEEFYEIQNNQPMSEEQEIWMRTWIEKIWEDR